MKCPLLLMWCDTRCRAKCLSDNPSIFQVFKILCCSCYLANVSLFYKATDVVWDGGGCLTDLVWRHCCTFPTKILIIKMNSINKCVNLIIFSSISTRSRSENCRWSADNIKASLRSELLPALEEVLGRHLCGLKELVERHGEFQSDVLRSSTVSVSHSQRSAEEISNLNKVWFRHQPELDVEHRSIREVWHTLDVEDLLDLSPAVQYRVHILTVDIQLWTRGQGLNQYCTHWELLACSHFTS